MVLNSINREKVGLVLYISDFVAGLCAKTLLETMNRQLSDL